MHLAALALFASATLPNRDLAVDRGAYTIHAQEMGRGAPIVAIAGGPGFSGRALWSFGYDMQDVSRIILFDQLGTGESRMKDTSADLRPHLSLDATIDDLEALRTSLGLKKWTVFGQSWGAIVALSYAAKHPQSVDRLIIASTPGMSSYEQVILSDNLERLIPPQEMAKMVAVASDPNMTDDQKLEAGVLMQLPYYFFHPYEGEALAARAPAGIFAPKVFSDLYPFVHKAKVYDDIRDGIKRWKGQTLILHGHHDPCGGAMGFALKDRFIPNAKVEMFVNGGHFPWLESDNSVIFYMHIREWMHLPMKSYMTDDYDVYVKGSEEAHAQALAEGWPFNYVPPSKSSGEDLSAK